MTRPLLLALACVWALCVHCSAEPGDDRDGSSASPFGDDPPLQTTNCVQTPDLTDYGAAYKAYKQPSYGLSLTWLQVESGSYIRVGPEGPEHLFVDQCAGIVTLSRKAASGVQRVRWRIGSRR